MHLRVCRFSGVDRVANLVIGFFNGSNVNLRPKVSADCHFPPDD